MFLECWTSSQMTLVGSLDDVRSSGVKVVVKGEFEPGRLQDLGGVFGAGALHAHDDGFGDLVVLDRIDDALRHNVCPGDAPEGVDKDRLDRWVPVERLDGEFGVDPICASTAVEEVGWSSTCLVEAIHGRHCIT